ncbi:glycosyltransferase [Pseudoalteromonas sp. SR41-1]|uniref:glycosyltransferase n=1 Tax=Pseudoalteromonas sp. SR41-1 TaxID=2760952 RepID=UPI0016022FE0|nr:glycosyltransferase [Pseudoalteromonas sp. SR41-1]MBB1279843.1 glycosyltransferase [Pseudoalteromonas sp. SR41-1]
MDKISVIITSFNRGEMLRRAIDSVLNQDYKNFELIIVDDCSDSPTQKVLDAYEGIQIVKIIRMQENSGANICRNVGINSATGVFYTGLDDDDYFLPSRLNILYKNFDKKFSFICDNYQINNGNKLYKRFLGGERVFNPDKLTKTNQAGNQIFTYLERVKDIAGFDENLKRLQDQDTWYRLALKFGKFKRIDKCSYVMDVSHEATRITKSIKERDSYYAFYNKHKDSMSRSSISYNRLRLAFLNNEKLTLIKYDKDNIILFLKLCFKRLLFRSN